MRAIAAIAWRGFILLMDWGMRGIFLWLPGLPRFFRLRGLRLLGFMRTSRNTGLPCFFLCLRIIRRFWRIVRRIGPRMGRKMGGSLIFQACGRRFRLGNLCRRLYLGVLGNDLEGRFWIGWDLPKLCRW